MYKLSFVGKFEKYATTVRSFYVNQNHCACIIFNLIVFNMHYYKKDKTI